MEGYSSQIAERIRMLQEQNDALDKEKEEADRAMAEGQNVSTPVVEQIRPDPNRKKGKKKKVSVQRSDISRVFGDVGESPEPVPQQDMRKEPADSPRREIPKEPEISPQREYIPPAEEIPAPQESAREKGSRAALDASLGAMEDLFGEKEERHQKKGMTSTVSISGKEAERIREEIRAELRREMEAEAREREAAQQENRPAQDTNPRHRGPHAVIQKKIKYVDTSGTPLKEFSLIDEATGEVRPLKDTVLIGKNESCDIVIPNRYVSRRHARITCRAGAYYIEDLGSTNGTIVNGEKLSAESGERQIEPGDRIEFAACRYIFDAIG